MCWQSLPQWARATGVMALLLFLQTCVAWGGEKASISVPKRPTTVNPAATRPAESFRPLEPANTTQGSTDPGAPPAPIIPNAPDPRTQKELVERLDRQRNWLLEDPENFGKGDSASQWLPNLEEQDYTTNPRRPQTALGRRLKGETQGTRGSTESEGGRFESPAVPGDNDFDDPLGTDAKDDSRSRFGLNPSWSAPRAVTSGGLLDLSAPLPDPSGRFSDRSTGFGRPGRGLSSGLDPFSQERLDRYDRMLSSDESLERSSSLGDSTERMRQRELRTEVLTPAMRNPAAAPPAATLLEEETGSTAAPVTRSGFAGPLPGVAAGNNPYLPPIKTDQPYESPAAKLLRTPPVQPPRFRP